MPQTASNHYVPWPALPRTENVWESTLAAGPGLQRASKRTLKVGGVAVEASSVLHDERGAGAVEYGLIAFLIAVVVAAGLALFGDEVRALFEAAANAFANLIS